MEKLSFVEILDCLEGLDAWLQNIGIKPKNDRIHQAIRIVSELNDKWKASKREGHALPPGDYGKERFALIEALEWGDILKAFDKEPAKKIKPKIERALGGPSSIEDEYQKEDSSNTVGRNTQFELALAAEWRLRGLQVDIGEPDCTLNLEGATFFMECKRPFREHSIRANVRGAGSQLRNKLDGNLRAAGIIAISVSRILNPGTRIFWTPTEEESHHLGDRAESMMHENEQCWRRAKLHDRIVAVLFHTSTPGIVGDQDVLCRMRNLNVMAVDESCAFEKFKSALSPLYSGK